MKKVPYHLVIFLTALLLFFPMRTGAADFPKADSLSSTYIAVYNVQNGHVVFAKDADSRIAPSSTAKIMTGILALESFGNRLDTKITVTAAALRGLEGSTVLGLKSGEEISVRDLLYAMLVAGANDAANVLAIEVAGGILPFVSMMNEKAAALGAENTLYLNATGLDNDSAYTTAADTAKIAAYAYRNPTFMEMCNARTYTVSATNKNEEVTVYTRNLLLSTQYGYYDANAQGMITGYTERAGYCTVSIHDNGAFPYVCVAMGAQKDADGTIGSYRDVKNLLNWATGNFIDRKILDKAKIITELPVRAGSGADHVLIVPEDSLYAFLDIDADLSQIKLIPELETKKLSAPVEKGEKVGTLTLQLDGEVIGSVALVAKSGVKKSSWINFWDTVGKILSGKPFLIALGVLIGCFFIFTTGRYFAIYKKANSGSHHKNNRRNP